MQKIWEQLLAMFSNITFVDIILYIAVIMLIILVSILFYMIKTDKESAVVEESEEPVDNELDLNKIVEEIDENPKPLTDMTAYESEQEQKAIISYDELLAKTGQLKLNYEDEKIVDDTIPVKKIGLAPISLDEIKEEEVKPEVNEHAFFSSYASEEAFLATLKQMNELLNG